MKKRPNIDQLLKNELSTSFSNFTKEGNFLRREETKQRNLIEFNFVENLSATELINFERFFLLILFFGDRYLWGYPIEV